jgi:Phycobilisome protein
MNTEIQLLIEQAQDRYLKSDDLAMLETYMRSLNERIALYRYLRDREIKVLQLVATELEAELPNVAISELEAGIKNMALVMRYCAMAMLLQDPNLISHRLMGWMKELNALQEMQQTNDTVYRLLIRVLQKDLSQAQLVLLQPLLDQAQTYLLA